MLRITIKMPPVHTRESVIKAAADKLKTDTSSIKDYIIIKKSLDARDKSDIHYVYTVGARVNNESRYANGKDIVAAGGMTPRFEIAKSCRFKPALRPVIAGAGPAGLFCALSLAMAGFEPIIIERGRDVDRRMQDVEHFFNTGELNTESNVQFGEGGAGTFSDGKLTTGSKSPFIPFILNEFVEAGADEEISYLSKPHIGTDKLVEIVKNIRRKIEALGGEFRFGQKVSGINHTDSILRQIIVTRADGVSYGLETGHLVLAIGHSARDTLQMLIDAQIAVRPKPFAIGFRIEHELEMINFAQYGKEHIHLGAADYKLTYALSSGRGAYTFCMCPGGAVIAAASEHGCLVVNGMSKSGRDMPNSNSALLITVTPADFETSRPLSGIEFQRRLERMAFDFGGGGYIAPAQTVGDFLAGRKTGRFGCVVPSYRPGVAGVNLAECFDAFIIDGIREAIVNMDKRLKGFADNDAVLTAIETRSSSPVTVIRDARCESNIKGVFSCGEGGGHAGGIMSAAADGLRCAEIIKLSF